MLRRHGGNAFACSKNQKNYQTPVWPERSHPVGPVEGLMWNQQMESAPVREGLQDQPGKCVFFTWRGRVQNPGDPSIACAFPRCLFSFKASSEGEGKEASGVPIAFSVDVSLYPFDILDKQALSNLKELFGRPREYFLLELNKLLFQKLYIYIYITMLWKGGVYVKAI